MIDTNDIIQSSSDGFTGVETVQECDNCCTNFLRNSEHELIKKVKIKTNFSDVVSEIQIWDALTFIYGVPWQSFENYNLEKKGSCKISEELQFCNICASLLTENYHSHHNFEVSSHSSSFVESLKKFCANQYNSATKSKNDSEVDKEAEESLFEDFTFTDQDSNDDLLQSPETPETKYKPNFSTDTNFDSTLIDSVEKKVSTPRRESLRSRQPVIKVEKISQEEIRKLTNKKGAITKRKNPNSNRKNVTVKYAADYEEKDIKKECDEDDMPSEVSEAILIQKKKKPTRKVNKVAAPGTKRKNELDRLLVENKLIKTEHPRRTHEIKPPQNDLFSLELEEENDKKTHPEVFEHKVKKALEKISDKTRVKWLLIGGRRVCTACGKDYASRRGFRRHWNENHGPGGEKSAVCDVCGKGLKSQKVLRHHHIRFHASEEEKNKWKTTCQICQAVVLTFNLKSHNLKFHPTGPPAIKIKIIHKCDQCGKDYGSKKTLAEHYLEHTEEPQLCDICAKVFPSSISLTRHKNLIHRNREKIFACEKCPKKYFSAGLLQKHQIVHDDTRSFVCDECGKTFKYHSHFVSHLKCHREIQEKGEGAFTCEICNDGKTFKHSKSLKNHMGVKHGNRIYECSYCGKHLSCGTNLRQHEELHKESPGYTPRAQMRPRGYKTLNNIFEVSVEPPPKQ